MKKGEGENARYRKGNGKRKGRRRNTSRNGKIKIKRKRQIKKGKENRKEKEEKTDFKKNKERKNIKKEIKREKKRKREQGKERELEREKEFRPLSHAHRNGTASGTRRHIMSLYCVRGASVSFRRWELRPCVIPLEGRLLLARPRVDRTAAKV